MKIFYRLLFFLILSPLHLLWAATPAERLIGLLTPMQNLRANFTQIILDDEGVELQKSQGEMALQRPGRFRWEINKPNRQLLVADGKHIWFYDMNLQQIILQKQKILPNSPAALLSDAPQQLTQQFIVQLSKKGTGFYLLPKDKNAVFRSINLTFQKNQLKRMCFLDKLGQETIIDFTKINQGPINAKQFRFNLPKNKNIEIVRG